MSMLLDTIQAASGPEGSQPSDVVRYMNDAQYHSNRYLLESALRDIGAAPATEGAFAESPYDDELRKLIDAIPLE